MPKTSFLGISFLILPISITSDTDVIHSLGISAKCTRFETQLKATFNHSSQTLLLPL